VFFPDLSRYTYTETGENVVNVGWLAAGAPMRIGEVDQIVRDELARMAREPTNLMRGFHYCDFCDAESPIVAFASDAPSTPAYLGSGEVRVEAGDIVYAAPTLIVHYIDAHGYLPPEEFIEAVAQLAT